MRTLEYVTISQCSLGVYPDSVSLPYILLQANIEKLSGLKLRQHKIFHRATIFFVFLSILGGSFTIAFSQNISYEDVRTLFLASLEDEKRSAELYNLLHPIKISDQNAVLYAYKGSSRAMMARLVILPVTKHKYFSEGKALIEKAVKLEPSNPEIRFLRLMIQLHVPAFLKYDNRDEDKQFLISYFKNNPPKKGTYEEKMVALIREYGTLSADQKQQLKASGKSNE